MIKKISTSIFLILLLLSLQSYCAKKCNDLILLLDPSKNETIEAKSLALSSALMTALQEQAAPILTTINLVKNFCFWKTEHADILKQIKHEVISHKNYEARDIKVKDIIDSLSPTKKSTFPSFQFAIPFCLIDISDVEWDCYIHKQAGLVLLIPKKYIISQTGNKNAPIEEYGFNASDMQKVAITPLESLLKYINDMEGETSTDLVTAVKSCFVTLPIDTTWNVYLVGHGSPAKKKKEFLANKSSIESSYETSQSIINTYRMLNDTKKLNTAVLQAKPYIQEYQLLQSVALLNNEDLIPQTAHIAGLPFNDFFELMKTLNTINTSFLFYTTCYGGGYNRVFMNDILQKLNVAFITVSEGYNESPTYTAIPQLIPDQTGSLKLSHSPFTNFFGLLNNFFGTSTSFGKTKTKQQLKTDPIATILSNSMNINTLLTNQPFVRIPSVGIFQALAVDKKVKILTHSLVKAYEFENRVINLTNPNIQAIMVYPEKITVPIRIIKSVKCISPTPQVLTNRNIIHIFENITIESWLKFILTDFISLNNSYTKTTFIIKNLRCFNSENLATTMDNVIDIKNMVIQITSDLIAGTYTFYTTVKSAFSLNEQDYSFETSFENNTYNKDNLIHIFDAPPTHPIRPELLQELADVTHSAITLDGVVTYLEQQIDTSTNVQKIGSLNKILFLKKLDSLEQQTTAKSIEEQITWLKKKNKPLTIINNRFKKHEQELISLQQRFDTLIKANQLNEKEKRSILQKITSIQKNIKNVDDTIKEVLSTGYFSRIIKNIKEAGHNFYEWLSPKK